MRPGLERVPVISPKTVHELVYGFWRHSAGSRECPCDVPQNHARAGLWFLATSGRLDLTAQSAPASGGAAAVPCVPRVAQIAEQPAPAVPSIAAVPAVAAVAKSASGVPGVALVARSVATEDSPGEL